MEERIAPVNHGTEFANGVERRRKSRAEGEDDALLSRRLDREKSKGIPSSSGIIKIVLLSYSLTLISKTPSSETGPSRRLIEWPCNNVRCDLSSIPFLQGNEIIEHSPFTKSITFSIAFITRCTELNLEISLPVIISVTRLKIRVQ